MNPPVCVLIVNWNGWQDTIECLESVFRSDYDNFKVIVCDNGSTDESLARIRNWAEGKTCNVSRSPEQLNVDKPDPIPKPLAYINLTPENADPDSVVNLSPWALALVDVGENLGFAGGNNVGLRMAQSLQTEYVWLLNNDTVIDRGALTALVRRMQECPGAGMCGSTLLHYDNPKKVQAWGGGYYCKWIGLPWHQGRLKNASDPINSIRAEKWMNYIVGASLLVSKEFLQDVGLMCEDYFLYFEELDWSLRGKDRYSLAYAPDSIVYHKIGASIGTSSNPGKKSLICDYYSVKNRIFFTKKFYPEALPTLYLFLAGAAFVRLLMGKFARSIMIVQLMLGLEANPRGNKESNL